MSKNSDNTILFVGSLVVIGYLLYNSNKQTIQDKNNYNNIDPYNDEEKQKQKFKNYIENSEQNNKSKTLISNEVQQNENIKNIKKHNIKDEL